MTSFLTSAFRHLVTAIAGILIHSSWAAGSSGLGITGALVFLLGLGLSWLHKAGVLWQLERLASLQRLARMGGEAAFLDQRISATLARELEERHPAPQSRTSDAGTSTAASLVALVILFFGSGCSSNSNWGTVTEHSWDAPAQTTATPERVESISRFAAFVGFRAYLSEHPDLRPAIDQCHTAIRDLVDQERWDIPAVAGALAATQASSLPSSEATLYIGSALILDDVMGPGRVDLKRSDHARAFILGMESGLALALASADSKDAPFSDDPWADQLRSEAEATRVVQRGEVK